MQSGSTDEICREKILRFHCFYRTSLEPAAFPFPSHFSVFSFGEGQSPPERDPLSLFHYLLQGGAGSLGLTLLGVNKCGNSYFKR